MIRGQRLVGLVMILAVCLYGECTQFACGAALFYFSFHPIGEARRGNVTIRVISSACSWCSVLSCAVLLDHEYHSSM